MAKESMKAREVKRAKLVAKYAAKRAALKEIVNKSNDPVEAYEAARKLQSILAMLILSVCTTVANSPVVLKVTSVCSVFHVSSSVKWLRLV